MAEDPIPTSPAPAAEKIDVGNPRDIQGIMGLSVVGGALVLGGVVIAITPSAAVQVFTAILATAGPIIGFYFGVKPQQ